MKIWNVFGVIFAWLLSIVMVIMLVAAPMTLSALSLLDPDTIAEAVSEALFEKDDSAAADPQNDYGIAQLASKKKSEKSIADKILEEVDMESIEDIVGGKIDEDVINDILASDAVEELLEVYTADVTNAITGSSKKTKFTADKLVEVVENNLDEIVEIIEDSHKELSAGQKKELKSEIKSTVRKNADTIVNTVPAPKEIRDAIMDSGEWMESVMDFLAKKNTAKLIVVGMVVLVSLLIFLLRMPGFKGLRWLATNLFTAGGFNVGICLFLTVGSSVVIGVLDGLEALGISALDGIVGNMIAIFTKGVIVRTVVIFVAAVALLVSYILLKIFWRKRSAKKAVPVAVAAPVVPVVPVAAPVAAPVVPVYTAPTVTIEPELITEPAPQTVEVTEENAPVAEITEENPEFVPEEESVSAEETAPEETELL